MKKGKGKLKNSKFLLKFFFVIAIILILTKTSFALGVSPAVVKYNFEPGLEKIVKYSVFGDANQKLELYVSGDLAEYVELDKDNLVGGGTFIAKLKLPKYIKKPGKHRIIIGVREKIDEELLEQAIGTSVTIQVVMYIYVPYPGKYLEVALKSHNVNVGEPVNFELEIKSQGKEDITIIPRIEITSQNKTIETLYFKEREIKSQEGIKLKKTLDTTNYNPGKYNAVAIVDYGKIARAESEFKIGELVIYITNYTKQIVIGDIKSFDIEIESRWNDNIDGAYAEVFIFNKSKSSSGSTSEVLISFKTSSTKLTPWGRKTITGFFDTSNFTEGFFDANITLVYYGKEVGKSSSELVKIEFVEEKDYNLIILIAAIIAGVVVLCMVFLLIKKYLLKNKKRKRSAKRRGL